MVNCKDCKHCTSIDYYVWYDQDGIPHREWMYFCEYDGYETEETAKEGECPDYVNYSDVNTTERP